MRLFLLASIFFVVHSMNGHWGDTHKMPSHVTSSHPEIPQDGLSGSWTGFNSQTGAGPLYDWYVLMQSGSTLTATCQITETSGCQWSQGTGSINGNQVFMSLDSSRKLNGVVIQSSQECNWTDAQSGGYRPPPYTPNCTVINWDDGSSWVLLQPIDTVHLIFMNHLDVGYNGIPLTGFINNILNIYFHEYFPRALSVARTLRSLGLPQRLIYTSHAWIIKLYLNCPPNFVLAGVKLQCPSEQEVADFETAVREGVITWHRGPMNMQPENMDATLWEAGLQEAAELDNQFGFPLKKTLSQRDVPGMTRGVIPLLVKHGVTALSVGVNYFTCSPHVPKAFVWRDLASGTDVIALFHAGGYPNDPGTTPQNANGLARPECVVVKGFNEALCWAFRTDNHGPPEDISEVLNNYQVVQSQFPGSKVIASTFDNFVEKLSAFKANLPVITSEIGDIWIQGIASDPLKMSQFRVMARQRAACIAQKQCSMDDTIFANFTRWLIKPPEHTWGLPQIGNGETSQMSNDVFHQARKTQQDYKDCESAWIEQRNFNDFALQTLKAANYSLYYSIQSEFATMVPRVPSTSGYKLVDSSQQFTCGGVTIGFDGTTGGITRLRQTNNGREWASPSAPLAAFSYATYNESLFSPLCNGVLGGKPGADAAGAETRTWLPSVKGIWQSTSGCSFLVELSMPSETITKYGGAQDIWNQIDITDQGTYVTLDMTFQWFNKTSTRLPESYFLSFTPSTQSNYKWAMDKLGSAVDPTDVIDGGSQHQHAVWDGFKYYDPSATSPNFTFAQIAATSVSGLWVWSEDVPLTSPITTQVGATPFQDDVSTLSGNMLGIAYNLFNNVWNTNYALYYPYIDGDTDQLLRFQLVVS